MSDWYNSLYFLFCFLHIYTEAGCINDSNMPRCSDELFVLLKFAPILMILITLVDSVIILLVIS